MRVRLSIVVAALVTAACGTGDAVRLGSQPGPVEQEGAGWTETDESPLTPRHEAWTAVIGDHILIVGGRDTPACPPNASCVAPSEPALRDGALYDPDERAWSPVPDAPQPITGSDQSVTIGSTAWSLQTADRRKSLVGYDVDGEDWRTAAVPEPSLASHLAAVGSRILVFAGSHENGGLVPDRLFDPATGVWEELPRDPIGSAYDRSFVDVPAGLVLLAIPLTNVPPPDRPRVFHAAVYDRATRQWSGLPPSTVPGYATTWFRSGSKVVNPTLGSADGGQVNGWDRAYAFGGVLDVESRTWLPLPTHHQVAIGSGSSPVATSDRWIISTVAGPPGPLAALDLATMDWTDVNPAPKGLPTGASVGLTARHLVVWGGATFDREPRGVLHADGMQLALP